jgi:hypothetical protein
MPDPGVGRFPQEAGLVEIPEQVATEDPLRQRRVPRPDRQVNHTGVRELFGDLKPGVASTNHQHWTIGKVLRRPVLGAVDLEYILTEVAGDRRHARDLKRSRSR